MTRRGALAAGAALGGSILVGAPSFAGAANPLRAVDRLRDQVRRSDIDDRLRSRLLAIIGRARAHLKRDRSVAAANVLEQELKPVLEANRGRHGLSGSQARRWIDDTNEIVSRLSPDTGGAPGAFGVVHIFNLWPDSIRIDDLNGQGPIGEIPAANRGDGWTPRQITASRTNLNLSQIEDPLFCNQPDVNSVFTDLGGARWLTHVAIPSPPRPGIQEDLLLYLADRQAFLFSSSTGELLTQSQATRLG